MPASVVFADREFIRDWFAFLLEQSVDFVIRLALTLESAALCGHRTDAPKHHPILSKTGLTLHLVCHRPARGERILLITNRTDLKQVLAVYGALGY